MQQTSTLSFRQIWTFVDEQRHLTIDITNEDQYGWCWLAFGAKPISSSQSHIKAFINDRLGEGTNCNSAEDAITAASIWYAGWRDTHPLSLYE